MTLGSLRCVLITVRVNLMLLILFRFAYLSTCGADCAVEQVKLHILPFVAQAVYIESRLYFSVIMTGR